MWLIRPYLSVDTEGIPTTGASGAPEARAEAACVKGGRREARSRDLRYEIPCSPCRIRPVRPHSGTSGQKGQFCTPALRIGERSAPVQNGGYGGRS